MFNKGFETKQLIYVPIFLVGFVLLIILLNYIGKNTFEKFPEIKCNEEINAIIEAMDKYKGTTLLKDKKGREFSIRAFNWDIKPNVLYYHLEVGDSITRQPNSDTLYLYKKKDSTVIEFEVQCLE